MRWFRFLPISALVLLAGIVGIMQLRDQAGIQSGYLMAGACLILAGLLAAQSLIKDTDGGGNMGEVTNALKEQTKAIAGLAQAIKDEAEQIAAAVASRSVAQANAIASAIEKRTQAILDITSAVEGDDADQELPTGPTGGPDQGLPGKPPGTSGETPDRPDQGLPTGIRGGTNRPDQGLSETPEPKR